MHAPVVHLELHTSNLARAVDFYGRLLGWDVERIEHRSGAYVDLALGDRIGGGVVEGPGERALWLPYAEVPDAAEATERARKLGARIVLEPREGPAGWRSVIASPAGAELALWQPKERASQPAAWTGVDRRIRSERA